MVHVSPCNVIVTKRRYWLCILFVALLVSVEGQAQGPASIIELPYRPLTYASALQIIGKELHVLPSHEIDCPELNGLCPVHGKMRFEQFFEPLKAEGLGFKFEPDTIRRSMMLIIKRAPAKPIKLKTFTAWTTDEAGGALSGVCVRNLTTRQTKYTDSATWVRFEYTSFPVKLFFTYVGRHSVPVTVLQDSMTIPLEIDPKALEAATVSCPATTRAVTTAGYSTVTDAEAYPYHRSNHALSGISTGTVQTMLEGRMAGVLTTQTSGIPGSSSYLSVRGQGSIANGIDPLYIIDGIPAAAGNSSLSNIQSRNAGGSLSSWNSIAPADIERIDVLRDGDATAIYGSRGANGVVLVTTKHWKAGLPSLELGVSAASSRVRRGPAFLNTGEYLAMRREALQNSGDTASSLTAPDLTMVDTSRNFDWGKWLLGRSAVSTDIHLSVAGGARKNNYTVGLDRLTEATPFPTRPGHDRACMNFNYNHHSDDRRWELNVSGLAGRDVNHQCIGLDPTIYQTLAPDAPPTLDKYGRLNFPAGVFAVNPLGQIVQPYEALSGNYLLSMASKYALSSHWFVRATAGFNSLATHEFGAMPLADQNPAFGPMATGFFSTTRFSNRVFEPQLEYRRQDGRLSLNWIGGASLQRWDEHAFARLDTGYVSDVTLLHHGYAVPMDTSSVAAHDSYSALFTNVNANWDDRYVLNFTWRRDGSSRFAAPHRFADFGSVGLAWIFSDTRLISRFLPFVSYGKIKISEGVCGNNEIGDRTLANFAGTSIQSFQSISGLYPSGSAGLGWEKTYKRELSLDLGFVQNRLLFNVTGYRHYSDNLFENGEFPMTRVGFVAPGLPAVVENWGYEFSLSATFVDNGNFSWQMGVNWTIPRGKLVSFPGLNKSIYAGRLVLGESINVLRGYVYKGVDSQTGLYRFADLDGDGRITAADRKVVGRFDVTGFGGFENTIRWRQFQLQVLVDARIATGVNYLAPIFANNPPGTIYSGFSSNVPRVVLDHWRRVGDRAAYQKLYAAPDVDADSTMQLYLNSSALLANTSFFRLRRVSLAYDLPAASAASMHLSSLGIFVDAQNIWVCGPYKADPEIQSVLTMPTMRTVEIGVRLSR